MSSVCIACLYLYHSSCRKYFHKKVINYLSAYTALFISGMVLYMPFCMMVMYTPLFIKKKEDMVYTFPHKSEASAHHSL